ncbi:DUF6479 family protein [Streptomyces sp. NRRL F-2664]|uniref:DUF6479 family protein n=1 Tax=Streptomyces sp. NRRL F-2664 TaxID=1463842 RepID=UPI0004C9DC51|nr:DUF6479 family protein [Streptomyces sp. NRRL F-2664]
MTESVTLAASAFPSLLLILAGLVVVALLIGAFWYGSRRAKAGMDPGPLDQGPAPTARRTSWQTPDDAPTDPDAPRGP